MNYLDAFILGLIQGLTEFLPVSSSGHLLLAEKIGLGTPSIAVNLALHLATLAAVLITYRRAVWDIIKHPFSKKTALYVLACIPTGIIALLIEQFCKGLLLGSYLPLCFTFSAFILTVADRCKPRTIKTLSYRTAFLTGVMQGIAVLPGISRSGSTIAALTLCGVDKKDAKEFSFMLSIPVIIAGALYELPKFSSNFSFDIWPLILAMVTAFFAGLVSIRLTAKAIDKGSFLPFVIYLVAISAVSFFLLSAQ